MDGLVQLGLCWFRKFARNIKENGFGQSHTDPFVFRRLVDGKLVTVIVAYVDEKLLTSRTTLIRTGLML